MLGFGEESAFENCLAQKRPLSMRSWVTGPGKL